VRVCGWPSACGPLRPRRIQGVGDSEWSEHANLRDPFTMDCETIVDGVGEQCDVLPEAGQETMTTVNYPT